MPGKFGNDNVNAFLGIAKTFQYANKMSEIFNVFQQKYTEKKFSFQSKITQSGLDCKK